MNKRQSQSGSGHLVIVFILVIALIGALGYIAYDRFMARSDDAAVAVITPKQKTEEKPTTTVTNGDFANHGATDGYYGTARVRGYATAAERYDIADVGYCGHNGELCNKVSYVSFNVTENNDPELAEYLLGQNGNSFAGPNMVGIGCIADGTISYTNISDAKGSISHTISKTDTTKIMASTIAKPIVLEVTRLKFTGGGGASACYSHFDSFSVIE